MLAYWLKQARSQAPKTAFAPNRCTTLRTRTPSQMPELEENRNDVDLNARAARMESRMLYPRPDAARVSQADQRHKLQNSALVNNSHEEDGLGPFSPKSFERQCYFLLGTKTRVVIEPCIAFQLTESSRYRVGVLDTWA